MPKNTKKKCGRPSKYDPKYCQLVIDWMDREPYSTDSQGKKTPNDLPTFEKFAHSIGVHKDTVYEWAKVHKNFSDSLKKAKALQQDFWLTNSLHGLYPPGFACFAGKNMFGWRDKIDHDHKGAFSLTVTREDTECL